MFHRADRYLSKYNSWIFVVLIGKDEIDTGSKMRLTASRN